MVNATVGMYQINARSQVWLIDDEDNTRFMPLPAKRSFLARVVDIGLRPAQDQGRRVVYVHLEPDGVHAGMPHTERAGQGTGSRDRGGHLQTSSLLRCGITRLMIRAAYLPIEGDAAIYPAQVEFLAQDWLRANRRQNRTWPYTEQEAADLLGRANRLTA